MTSALIGHTGFVGGNLLRQTVFDDLYNSSNVEELSGKSYDLLVCAGAPAKKWMANRKPEEDWANIQRLMSALGSAKASNLILISTVDVYPSPIAVDEESAIDLSAATAYGRHRFRLEEFASQNFPHVQVLRLPGLFGPGLKKNIVFDLLHGNCLDVIHPKSVFQFYDLNELWRDIERLRDAGFKLLNLATEPTSVEEVAREAFGLQFENAKAKAPVRYDFRSCYGEAWGASGAYLYDKSAVLQAMRRFVESQGWQRP